MTADELADAARELFGDGPDTLRRLADALGVRHNTLVQIMAGKRDVPPGMAADAQRLLDAARVEKGRIAPPPGGLGPHLDALRWRAEAAGWAGEMVLRAVADWLERRRRDG